MNCIFNTASKNTKNKDQGVPTSPEIENLEEEVTTEEYDVGELVAEASHLIADLLRVLMYLMYILMIRCFIQQL